MSDSLHERGRALEDLFFKNRDQQLLDAMREKMEATDGRAELKSTSGIDDDSVIDALIAVGVNAKTIATVGLIPLIAVAWADSKMESNEVAAVLKATAASGISADSESYSVIDGWLKEQPPADLLDTWKQYVAALKGVLNDAQIERMKVLVLARATTVAEAAGGFLGVGNKVSDVEENVIADLASAFEG